MYKPFVTCDDPKGVLECGSIRRRSLSCVPKRDERVGKSPPEKGLEGLVREPRSSTFSLMEISGEARKLSQILDAWSRKKFRGGQSREIAKDIAESLAMLEKMQTSHYISSPNRKMKDSDVSGEGSRRQGPSRRRMEKTMCTNEGDVRVKRSYSIKKHETGFDSASYSSTDRFCKNKSCSSSSSSLRRPQQGQQQGPNLIARLMGLEECPSKQVQKLPAEKTLTSIYEVKTASSRRGYETPEPEQKTLNDVLETMRSVGLLASVSPVNSRSLDDACSDKRLIDDVPPVVLIKPMPNSKRETDEVHKNLNSGKGNSIKKRQTKVEEAYAGTRARYGDQYLLERGIQFGVDYTEENDDRRVDDGNDGGDEIKLLEKEFRSLSEKSRARRKMTAQDRIDGKLQSSYDIKVVNHQEQSLGKRKCVARLQARSRTSNESQPNLGKPRNRPSVQVERKKTTVEVIELDQSGSVVETVVFVPIPQVSSEEEEESSQSETKGHGNPVHECEAVNRDNEVSKTGSNVKILLASSLSFATFVEELFHVEIKSHSLFPVIEPGDSKACEAKLVVDYAKEFVKRRAGEDYESLVPISRLSFEQLVETICSGVETLMKHSDAVDSLMDDTLERDLRCKRGLCGTWEAGWRRGYSCAEQEQTVVDLERLILRDLISELAR